VSCAGPAGRSGGEVFGYPGLFVSGGAAYPAPPGVPPSLTIAALAERQAELIGA
jgi:cholesterol oxidase